MSTPKVDLGAGMSTAVQKPTSTSKELQHGNLSQFGRAMAMGSYFLSGIMAVNLSQIIGTPLYLINKDWYNAWIAFTKQSIGLLVTTMTQFWAPTTVNITGDKSMRGQLLKTVQGNLFCDFPERIVLMANHQIYTDWLYLWWIAYASGMHGRVYIVLKESLKRIPILGWGMQFSKFIFLKRNWEQDKPNLARHLKELNNPKEPMWLTLFPEGTNLAPSTRRASAKWAEKQRIKDMRHLLLPRSTGLRFMLQELRNTVDWVYDCTIAYDGVPRGQYAQDIYTFRSMYAGGNAPKAVHMHFRRFRVSAIPLDDAEAFELWLRQRWIEKDNLMEFYLQSGHFPADTGAERLADGSIRRGSGQIQTQIRSNKWYEFLQVFAPIGLFAMILYSFYGALPKKIIKLLQKQTVQNKIEMIKRAGQQITNVNSNNLGTPITITNQQLAFLKKSMAAKNITINQENIGRALQAGFFKPKDSLPANRTNQLAITNGTTLQSQAKENAAKSGLTSAEKRARARQRNAALVPASTPKTAPVAKPQPSPAVKQAATTAVPKKTPAKPVVSTTMVAKKPGSTTVPKPTVASKPSPAVNGAVKKVSNPVSQSTVLNTKPKAPSTISSSSRSTASTPSNPKSSMPKTIPKLPPTPDTMSVSSSSTRSIPKLEIRSKPGSQQQQQQQQKQKQPLPSKPAVKKPTTVPTTKAPAATTATTKPVQKKAIQPTANKPTPKPVKKVS